MGRKNCTEHQGLYNTAIPLLSYGPHKIYISSGPVQYSYTSTHATDSTGSTETQVLYSRAIILLPPSAVRTEHNLRASKIHLYLYSTYGPYGLYRPQGL